MLFLSHRSPSHRIASCHIRFHFDSQRNACGVLANIYRLCQRICECWCGCGCWLCGSLSTIQQFAPSSSTASQPLCVYSCHSILLYFCVYSSRSGFFYLSLCFFFFCVIFFFIFFVPSVAAHLFVCFGFDFSFALFCFVLFWKWTFQMVSVICVCDVTAVNVIKSIKLIWCGQCLCYCFVLSFHIFVAFPSDLVTLLAWASLSFDIQTEKIQLKLLNINRLHFNSIDFVPAMNRKTVLCFWANIPQ